MVRSLTALAALLAVLGIQQTAGACPFCSAVNRTLSEELDAVDVAAIGKLVAASTSNNPNVAPKATFEIVKVLKGDKLLGSKRQVETLFFSQAKPGDLFVLTATEPPHLAWSSPIAITPAGEAYFSKLVSLPRGPKRLEFFLGYLEHKDELLAKDAFDEFAKAPYSDVKAMKDKINHVKIVGWVTDTESVVAGRRRLYFTMLGITGGPEDVPMLVAMLRSPDSKQRQGLDALIGCLLVLDKEKALPLVEELYLSNRKADFADTYSAIVALRTVGTELNVVSTKRICESMRLVLDRPTLADLVIPDLARWEDWSVMPRLVELFKKADDKTAWVRVPVVNFLRACPLPEAKKHLAELQKLDPETFERANSFFPFGAGAPVPPADTPAPNKASQVTPAGSAEKLLASRSSPDDLPNLTARESPPVNPFALVGVPFIAGCLLYGVMNGILRGGA